MLHLIFTVILVIAQLKVTKRFAFVPVYIAAIHTSYAQVLPSLTTLRILIIISLLKAFSSGQLIPLKRCSLDVHICLLFIVGTLSAFFHEPSITYPNPVFSRLRITVDILGTYFFARTYLVQFEDFFRVARFSAFALLPMALLLPMTVDSGRNPYSILGGASYLLIRDGEFRAAGPFGTPILAGTAAAMMTPLFVMIWSSYRKTALLGFFCSALIILSTGSSTPIGNILMIVCFIYLWKFRQHIKLILIGSIFILILMDLVKERPIWYLIAITDFTGSSTGFHRAQLIDMAIKYVGDWWLFGTEYTRHWMPYGLPSLPEHCDLTNYYIYFGVLGGITMLLLLVSIFIFSFKALVQAYNLPTFKSSLTVQFSIWCLGSLLLTHMITCLTIAYFDHSSFFFFSLIAFIANIKEQGITVSSLQ